MLNIFLRTDYLCSTVRPWPCGCPCTYASCSLKFPQMKGLIVVALILVSFKKKNPPSEKPQPPAGVVSFIPFI